MTIQQTDIEKTLKRILARELKEWPEGCTSAMQQLDSKLVFFYGCGDDFDREFSARASDAKTSEVTRADWEAERALLASEQAKPLGDSEEFDQALWDKVASNAIPSFLQTSEEWTSDEETSEPMKSWSDIAKGAAQLADAFMAERAKRIAARKASHD